MPVAGQCAISSGKASEIRDWHADSLGRSKGNNAVDGTRLRQADPMSIDDATRNPLASGSDKGKAAW
jgi:hypothetical protein